MPEWYGGSALNSATLGTKCDQWTNQWARVCRWYKRVLAHSKKCAIAPLTAEDVDDILSYFHNAYALRDWLCDGRPEFKSAVGQLFESHFELGALRDICNGFKHKSLSRPSKDAAFNFYREYDPFASEIDPSANPVSYRFGFADGDDVRTFDVFEFAYECHCLWHDFLMSNGLLRSTSTSTNSDPASDS